MYDPALKTFLTVADYSSFTKASSHLFLSPTAVMKQMNALEGRLGVKLFDRRPQGCTLTEAGQIIYRYAEKIIDLSDTAIREAQQAEGREHRVFRIGTSILNPAMPFLDMWKQISDQFPGFTLEMVPFDDDHSDIMNEISQIGKTFDFFIGVCDSRGWKQHVSFLQTGTMRKMVAVPLNDPLAKKTLITRDDLHGRTLIMVGEGDSMTNDKIRADLSKNDPEITIQDAPIHYDMSVFNDAVTSGNVLLNNECWANVHPMLKTIPVDWNYIMPFGVIYAKNPSPQVQRLINEISKLIRKEKQHKDT